jgi:hypothetical protein
MNIPERGNTQPCPFCAVPKRNEHSILQSGECDGIKRNVISSTRAMEIRKRNSGKVKRDE